MSVLNQVMFGGFIPAGSEWILIVVVLLLLFGGSQLPKLARSIGQSKKAFKEGIEEASREDNDKSLNSATASKSLSGISDEELFEEARRRAQEMKR